MISAIVWHFFGGEGMYTWMLWLTAFQDIALIYWIGNKQGK